MVQGCCKKLKLRNFNRPPQLYQANSAPFEIPSQFEIGFAYAPRFDDINTLQLSTSFQNNNFSGDEYKLGAEYAYDDLLLYRGVAIHLPLMLKVKIIYMVSQPVLALKYELDDID
jgi:hypothetical protein